MKFRSAFILIASFGFAPLALAQENAAPAPSVSPPGVSADIVIAPPDAPATTPVPANPEPGASVAEPAPAEAADANPLEAQIEEQAAFFSPGIDMSVFPSLFFSVWERDLIIDARRGLNTRPPGSDDGAAAPVESPREVTLGGIVYTSTKDWTIWLNDMRISPGRLPSEVMDLKVHKDYIELEWFDAQTNQIFPIRLRPHQRFNLDSRMFLPGR